MILAKALLDAVFGVFLCLSCPRNGVDSVVLRQVFSHQWNGIRIFYTAFIRDAIPLVNGMLVSEVGYAVASPSKSLIDSVV